MLPTLKCPGPLRAPRARSALPVLWPVSCCHLPQRGSARVLGSKQRILWGREARRGPPAAGFHPGAVPLAERLLGTARSPSAVPPPCRCSGGTACPPTGGLPSPDAHAAPPRPPAARLRALKGFVSLQLCPQSPGIPKAYAHWAAAAPPALPASFQRRGCGGTKDTGHVSDTVASRVSPHNPFSDPLFPKALTARSWASQGHPSSPPQHPRLRVQPLRGETGPHPLPPIPFPSPWGREGSPTGLPCPSPGGAAHGAPSCFSRGAWSAAGLPELSPPPPPGLACLPSCCSIPPCLPACSTLPARAAAGAGREAACRDL